MPPQTGETLLERIGSIPNSWAPKNSWGAFSDFSDFRGISDLGMAFIPFGTSEVWSLLSHHHLLEAVVRGPGGPGGPSKPDRG